MKFDVDDKNRCRLVCVKFHLNRCRFAVVVAKCLGGSLFWDTVYSAVACVCVWLCGSAGQAAGLSEAEQDGRRHARRAPAYRHSSRSLHAHSLVVKDSRRKPASQRAPCSGRTHTHRPRNVGNNRPHSVRRKIYPDGRLIALKGGKLKVGNPTPEIG